MIVHADGTPAPLPQSLPEALRSFAEALAGAGPRFLPDPARAGFDVLCLEPLPGGPNRARLKLFAPDPRTSVAFLYKDSQVPFSSDRFAYGALVSKSRPPDPGDLELLVDYLASGFHPDRRFPALRRAFPFDVPR